MSTPRKPKVSLWAELAKNKELVVMVAPVILYFLVFSYLPMLGVYLAFTHFNFNGGLFGSPFVGMDNFQFLFESNILVHLTVNTILYNIAFIIFGTVTSMAAAVFLSEMRSRTLKKGTQSIIFLPYFISYVLLSVFVYNLFNYEHGSFNTVLKALGMPPVDMYSDPEAWKYILVLFHVWKWLGYTSVIYLAAITSIDSSLYEAAAIDGAGVLQKTRYITLPQLMPTFMVILMFNIGTILKGQFDLFWQIIGSNGQLYEATDIIDTYVYRTLTQNFDMGMATAAGLYQSVFGFVLVMTVNWILRKRSPENALF